MKALHGLSTINIELTSRCNKSCWMCGRRKIEKEYPEIARSYGDMPFGLVKKIAKQLPPGIVVQFHNNGEPLLYPRFGEAVKLFENQIRCVDTNAKLIVEKADEIIDNLHTITISVIQDDPEGKAQFDLVSKFLALKGSYPPRVIIRALGRIEDKRWLSLHEKIATRTIHSPLGSYDYERRRVIPEIGVCLEALHHLSVDRRGNVSPCVRFDPGGNLRIGNMKSGSLSTHWNSDARKEFLRWHIEGRRFMNPTCKSCEYWGVPG